MGIKAKKSLGQNFLRDENILRKIALSLHATTNCKVIEIGPGEGALTKYLVEKFPNLVTVEIDERAVEFLNEAIPGLNVIHKDILKTEWNELIGDNEQVFLIGNIPYNITSPIFFKMLDQREKFKQVVFLIQKEVAKRLSAKPNTKDYGILSVQAQYYGKVEYLFDVSRHAFRPIPNVESAVISYVPFRKENQVDLSQFKTVVRTAFNQRRKKLSNSIKQLITHEIDFDLNLRPEDLTPEMFADLTRKIFNK